MGAPDHYKSILLYGLYNGEPVAAAVDEQGRLILVTEPISAWAKSGTIIHHDDFTEGLTKSGGGGAGDDWAVALDYDEAASGGMSCELTAGSTAGGQATLSLYAHPSVWNKLGVEWQARFSNTYTSVELWIYVYTPTRYLFGKLRHVLLDTVWQAYDYTTGAWVDIVTDIYYTPAATNFQRFKLVIDAANERYHSFRHTGGLVDLSEYTLDGDDSTAPAETLLQFKIYTVLEENPTWNLDDIIITQDES